MLRVKPLIGWHSRGLNLIGGNPFLVPGGERRTVSVVKRRPVPKAIAFGGVATGSMNDIEHAIQAGNVK